MNSFFRTLFCFWVIAIPSTSYAVYAISADEIQRMPPFCRGLSLQNFQDDAKRFKIKAKAPGSHFQHFCHGMKSMLRGQKAEFRKKGTGKQQFLKAVDEFGYVLSRKKDNPDHIRAMVHLQNALALSHLGQVSKTLAEFNTAIKLKKGNYPYAYKKLAQFYIKNKQKDMALETVKTGLRYAPNDKYLNKLLHKLEKTKK